MSKEIIITANDLKKRLKAILRESGVDSKILNKSTGKIMKLFVSKPKRFTIKPTYNRISDSSGMDYSVCRENRYH